MKADVRVAPEYKGLFERNGLSSFGSFMGFEHGDTIKRISDRSVARFTLDGSGETFYIKRHRHRLGLKGMLFGKDSPALKEWSATKALEEAGIPCMKAVAVGQGFSSPFEQESFLVTVGLEGSFQLEGFVKEFAPPLHWNEVLRKRALIRDAALLAARLHGAGFIHRDFYLTHILAGWDGEGFKLSLIDLQRIEKMSFFRTRWLVKDIAALNYSAPSHIFTRADRMRFYKGYKGITRLCPCDKAFIRRILRKTGRIAAHTVKMYRRREERKRMGLLER